MKVSSEFDFGFEVVDGDKINQDVVQASRQEAEQYANEAQQLREMILPLLHNLAKKPESEYIKWPNRTETINKFINQLFEVSGLKASEDDLV